MELVCALTFSFFDPARCNASDWLNILSNWQCCLILVLFIKYPVVFLKCQNWNCLERWYHVYLYIRVNERICGLLWKNWINPWLTLLTKLHKNSIFKKKPRFTSKVNFSAIGVTSCLKCQNLVYGAVHKWRNKFFLTF